MRIGRTVEISYELRLEDYVDSATLAARGRRAVFIFDALVAGSSLIGGLVCCGLRYFLVGALLLFLSWFFLIKRIYGWRTPRLPKELEHEKDSITVRFSEQALEYQNIDLHLRAEWKEFSHYLEDANYFIAVFRAWKTFWTIPKRAFTDEQQLRDARRYLESIKNSAPPVPPIAQPY